MAANVSIQLADATEFKVNLNKLITLQRADFVRSGFPSTSVRVERLERMAKLLTENVDQIASAISRDFGHRSHDETRFEILGAVSAFRSAAANVMGWMQPEQYTPMLADAEARVEYKPLGVVGVIGPWNYPVVCVFGPLAGILAAGNRAIVKPSEFTPATSALFARLISATFKPDEISVVLGGPAEGEAFAAAPFDHLVFTGSTTVGKHVMRAAAANLTPLTLELGGKSPVIVSNQFDLVESAARVMAVKTRNAGQICLAPDYALVPAGSERRFAAACAAAVKRMFPGGVDSEDYTSIINDEHFARLRSIIEDARDKGASIIEAFSHSHVPNGRRMAPTLLLNVDDSMHVMSDEIFGPILPIVPYERIEQAIEMVRSRPHPLAIYYFGADDEQARKVLDDTFSGGVTINDVMTHMFAAEMPYGGVGASGTGAYFGKSGFLTFSHARAIYRQSERQEAVEILRAPYGDNFRGFVGAAIEG